MAGCKIQESKKKKNEKDTSKISHPDLYDYDLYCLVTLVVDPIMKIN